MLKPGFIYTYGSNEHKYCKEIFEFYRKKFSCRKPCVFVKTYGCQQNVSDSEKYLGMFLEMGFEITSFQENADVILFNTCAIRENAENKVFGNLGWIKTIKKHKSDLFVILCGCMTEQKTIMQKIQTTYPFVDLIMGTHSIHNFPEVFYKALMKKQEKSKGIYISEGKDIIVENIPSYRTRSLKAFVSVMYGCNNFCSYCIVPYVRGRERSRKSEDIVNEFKYLLDVGYKDITLLGQNVNSYGKGLEEEIDFPDLLERLDCFPGEYRIRFMTSHPKDATKKLFDTIAKSRHVVHHVHLPVQCGNNRVLDAMNRKYTKESYLQIINYARKVVCDITFTSDIIVGFPGETYEEFSETLDLIKKVKFSSLFTFIYSPREGTPAAKIPDGVLKQEKVRWLCKLLDVQKDISEKLCAEAMGKKLRVLAENLEENTSCLLCRTDGNVIVRVRGDKKMVGKFFDVKIIGYKQESLEGEII